MKIQICGPSGKSIDASIRNLKKFLSDQREMWQEDDKSFAEWADSWAKSALENITKTCYIQVSQ